MKRILGLLIVMVALFTCACGNKSVNINVDSVADEILENVEFEDELSKAEDSVANVLYPVEDAVKQNIYIGSGATAEEVAVFEFKDKNAADDAKEVALQRIENQKKSFKDYVPKELQKLDTAIVKTTDKYMVVCVSNGDKAEEIINKYF